MPVVRHLHIENFRGVRSLDWSPSAGVNAVVGPGDTGKSTILEALDLVLGARRSPALSDGDFHRLDVTRPIRIDVTVGELPADLLDLEYGLPLRGFSLALDAILPEPTGDLEPVVTIRLEVGDDLEPCWTFHSDAPPGPNGPREARSSHRTALQALRLQASPAHHLAWRQGSVLHRIAARRPDMGAALASASREARRAFAAGVTDQFAAATEVVAEVAAALGVRDAETVTAALDAHAVSIRDGAVALHDGGDVPLRGLGTGSARLLAAGLQARAAGVASVTLIDEFEHGLEPYRIARLLHHLGAKSDPPPQQIVLTTHSPVVLRELAASQVWVTRRDAIGVVRLHLASAVEDAQPTLRSCPEAFLSPSVLVCEGSTAVGLVRGLELWRVEQGLRSMALLGVATCDGGGKSMAKRALAFRRLGYRTALLRDCDDGAPAEEAAFVTGGGRVLKWEEGRSTEEQLAADLPAEAMALLARLAVEWVGEDAVRDGLRNHGATAPDVAAIQQTFPDDLRIAFGKAAKNRKHAWFKSPQERGERIGREVLGPHLAGCGAPLRATVEALFAWMEEGAADADAR